ncbi:MAG: hypothetical protein ACJATA_002004 [Sphingobacteriales bacterium]|jgi:hypothetical protein
MIKRLRLTFVALGSIFSTYSNAQYCDAQGSDCAFDFISRVTIGEVMDNDTKCMFYSDFTNNTTLNAQHLPSGIFNAVLQNETKISRSKLIVQ